MTESQAQEPRLAEHPSVTFESGVEVVTVSGRRPGSPGPGRPRPEPKTDFEVIDTGREARDPRFPRGRRADQPGDRCSTSAGAWRWAATWTVRGKPLRFAVGMLDGGTTRRRCSPSMRSSRRSSRSRKTSTASGGSASKDAVGHDVAVRRGRRDGRGCGRAGEPAPRDAGDHRRRRHRQPAEAPEVSAIASSIDVPVYLLTVVDPAGSSWRRVSALSADGAAAERRRSRTSRAGRAATCESPACRLTRMVAMRRSVRRTALSVLDHVRAGRAPGLAPARDSDPEEGPNRSRARRVHVRPGASRQD